VAWRGDRLILSQYDHVYGPYDVSTMLAINQSTAEDQMCRVVVFDVDQLEEAVAELDRLHAELDDPQRLSNTAARTEFMFLSRLEGGDVDAAFELVAPNMTQEDRRGGFSMPFVDREALVALVRTMFETGETASGFDLRWELVATQADTLALVQVSIVRGSGFATEFLQLCETGPDGLIRELVLFDTEDEAAARAELERRLRAGEGG
jgi:hypothetical protein